MPIPFNHPDRDVLAKELRQAILSELGKTEAYHQRREAEYRAERKVAQAEVEDGLAKAIRGCIVVAQVVVNKIIIPR